ncbi:MAG: GNAT family N-acetyltransferase [Candidatus Acidiferrum sp.]
MDELHELPDVDLARVPWRSTYVEELPTEVDGSEWDEYCENLRFPRTCGPCQDCRRLRFGNARRQHRVKWAVAKGLKLGLEVREAKTERDLVSWYQLYLLTMRNIAVPPRPYRFFRSLWESLHPSGRMRLLLAEQRREGKQRLVAGSIFLQFGQTVFYAFTGCSPEDLPLHAHDVLQMEAIRGACKAGFRWYDFGEVTAENASLSQFKTKWGGQPKPLYRYYHQNHGAKLSPKENGLFTSLTRKMWRMLPLPATEILGDLIYGRM